GVREVAEHADHFVEARDRPSLRERDERETGALILGRPRRERDLAEGDVAGGDMHDGRFYGLTAGETERIAVHDFLLLVTQLERDSRRLREVVPFDVERQTVGAVGETRARVEHERERIGRCPPPFRLIDWDWRCRRSGAEGWRREVVLCETFGCGA